jgi:hypothetical protein
MVPDGRGQNSEDMTAPDITEVIMVNVERRMVQRHRTLKTGHIAFNGAAAIDCRIRNLSSAGACLDVETPIGIPDDFILVMETDHLQRPCHIIWRAPSRLGVKFAA